MSNAAFKADTQQIVVDEVFPHAPENDLENADHRRSHQPLADGARRFRAGERQQFTFQTKPAGGWDGTIHCQVLEVIPNKRLAYAWQSGDERNVGYGSPLNTVSPGLLPKLKPARACNWSTPASSHRRMIPR